MNDRINLRGVDLNLIPVLHSLLKEASVTEASRVLGISQPATSQALGRLRALFKDPLLVKIGREMKLTPRARELRALTGSTCSAIANLLTGEKFDPATSTHNFAIATPDHMALLIGEELLALLKRTAPGISIRLVDVGFTIREQLIAETIDLALIGYFPDLLEGLCYDNDYPDPIVCVAPKGHPLSDRKCIRLQDLEHFSRLELDADRYHLGLPAQRGLKEPVQIAASHLIVLPLLAARSKTITLVPRSMAKLAAEHVPLSIIELAGDVKALDHCLAWSPANDVDQAHIWLRSLLRQILRKHFPLNDVSRID